MVSIPDGICSKECRIFQIPQNLAAKPYLGVHHGFLNVDGAEALLAGNSRYGIARLRQVLSTIRVPLLLRPVGVADINQEFPLF